MIYIAAHKEFDVPRLENYVPLQVGAEGKEDLGFLRDNTGDNISVKNPNFCELTGLYWIWKIQTMSTKGLFITDGILVKAILVARRRIYTHTMRWLIY